MLFSVAMALVTAPPPRVSRLSATALPMYDMPRLTTDEEIRLGRDGVVERQRRQGRVGVAFIVVDTRLSTDDVWSQLQDVGTWSRVMRGVRNSFVRERRRDGALRAAFQITKLRLPANVVFYAPDGAILPFALDKQCANLAVDSLDGYWRVEPSPNDPALTRVWLAAEVSACAIVPNVAIDYVASKALRRATAWLKPPSVYDL